jgi:hypothetical protein
MKAIALMSSSTRTIQTRLACTLTITQETENMLQSEGKFTEITSYLLSLLYTNNNSYICLLIYPLVKDSNSKLLH